MDIRRAELEDLSRIVEIHNQSIASSAIGYTEPFHPGQREDWLRSHTRARPLVVSVIDDEVVGWANLCDYRPGRAAFTRTAEISFHVDPAYRQRGVATALILHLIEQCPRLDIRTLIAIVLDANSSSANLLQKLGFEHWGSLPGVAQLAQETLGHLYFGYRVVSV